MLVEGHYALFRARLYINSKRKYLPIDLDVWVRGAFIVFDVLLMDL